VPKEPAEWAYNAFATMRQNKLPDGSPMRTWEQQSIFVKKLWREVIALTEEREWPNISK